MAGKLGFRFSGIDGRAKPPLAGSAAYRLPDWLEASFFLWPVCCLGGVYQLEKLLGSFGLRIRNGEDILVRFDISPEV